MLCPCKRCVLFRFQTALLFLCFRAQWRIFYNWQIVCSIGKRMLGTYLGESFCHLTLAGPVFSSDQILLNSPFSFFCLLQVSLFCSLFCYFQFIVLILLCFLFPLIFFSYKSLLSPFSHFFQ